MKKWSKKTWVILGIVLAAIMVLRFSLANIATRVVNTQLAKLKDYSGHIDGINIALWRGAYQIQGMKILKKEGTVPQPFFDVRLMDIALEWRSLFRGQVVASVKLVDAELNFSNGAKKSQKQSGQGEDWVDIFGGLVPLKINRFEVVDGEIHFIDPSAKPPVDVHVEELDMLAKNLRSREEGPGTRMGSVSLTAKVMDDSNLHLAARFNPFAEQPTFDFGVTVLELKLTKLNAFLLRYVGFDVKAGRIDVYAEGAAAKGKFKGYIKPMVKDLKVAKLSDNLLDLPKTIKKMLTKSVNWLFRNKNDQVATKFEFSGEYKEPQTSIWSALVYLYKNAYVRPLPQKLEGAAKVEDLEKEMGKDK